MRAALRRVLQEQSRTIRVPSRVQDTYSKIKRAESALLARSGTTAWQSKCPLGRAPARPLRLLRARLAAVGSLALLGRAGPPGAQPLPRLLEPAASKVADVTAFDPTRQARALG